MLLFISVFSAAASEIPLKFWTTLEEELSSNTEEASSVIFDCYADRFLSFTI